MPGVVVGIVQDGKVVFAGGFGVRELGKPAPVDADTTVMIASNTKALTTLLLAKLVDAKGNSTWDTPVTSVLPSFKLGDADTTQQVLIKHLICACTGLPRQDLEWLFEFKGVDARGRDGDARARCSRRASSASCSSTRTCWPAPAGFIGGPRALPEAWSSAPPTTRRCRRRCSTRSG